jgi:hypothetical protein
MLLRTLTIYPCSERYSNTALHALKTARTVSVFTFATISVYKCHKRDKIFSVWPTVKNNNYSNSQMMVRSCTNRLSFLSSCKQQHRHTQTFRIWSQYKPHVTIITSGWEYMSLPIKSSLIKTSGWRLWHATNCTSSKLPVQSNYLAKRVK